MKVADMTDSAISQGLAAGRHSAEESDAVEATAIGAQSRSGIRRLIPSAAHDENDTNRDDGEGYTHFSRGEIRIGNLNGWNYGLSWSQRKTAVGVDRLVKYDFDGNALNNLDVVAGCILWREKAEAPTASRLYAIDVRAELISVQRIHRNLHNLAGPHPPDLILFKVRSHPNLLWNKSKKTLADLDVSAGLNCLLSHPTRLRRSNFRIRLVQ